jgi:hypothetical protein
VRSLTFFPMRRHVYPYPRSIDCILHLAFAIASTRHVNCGAFVASVRREIIAALVSGNHVMLREVDHLYNHSTGHARLPAHLLPTTFIDSLFFLRSFSVSVA